MNSLSDIWTLVLNKLKAELSETTISTWFDETEVVALEERTLFLCCPSDFKRSTIESMYAEAIRSALNDIYSAEFDVRLLSEDERRAFGKETLKKPASLLDSGEFTFDSFVVGESNKLAYAMARAVAAAPAERYNPLFIYGDSGLGKTHLIYAIAHELRQANPYAKIAYVKGDDFTNELVNALQFGPDKTAEMRDKYRKADLLLVDDVQFIAGKQRTQEEFFNTFNALYESKRQIVLTSDRPPHEMQKLDDRLQSRFEWGMLVDIQPPDYETRLAIIKNKASQRGAVIGEEILSFIAEHVTANVRQLEGAMNKIIAHREILGKDLTEEEINLALKDYMKNNITLAPTEDAITEEVARYFNLDPAALRGTSKKQEDVRARQITMYLIQNMIGISTPSIGKYFDRDHSTVLYSINQVKKNMQSNHDFEQFIKEIRLNIEAKK